MKLEGQGIVESLYHFLWMKNPISESLRNINLPDTVIFRFQQPIYWYFTSSEGKILRKQDSKLTNEEIYRHFVSHSPKTCEIVATYLYTKQHCLKTLRLSLEKIPEELRPEAIRNGRSNILCEFFDADALKEFLFERKKAEQGILQRFVAPKHEYNTMIRLLEFYQ